MLLVEDEWSSLPKVSTPVGPFGGLDFSISALNFNILLALHQTTSHSFSYQERLIVHPSLQLFQAMHADDS